MELENLLQQFRKPYGSRTYIGLNRIKAILEVLGNPQNRFLAVHIAGTNGKGSVSSMLHSVFSEFNLKVGLFTSPHLERFSERIKINNIEIDEKEFISILTNIVIPAIEKIDTVKLDTPTEFEVITITAFYYFYIQNVDIAIIEAGLGGRMDSTNVLENLVFSVITSISQDHTDRLGKSIREITSEKVGIIKPETNIISTELNSDKDLFYESVKNLNNSDISFLHFADSSLLYSDKINLRLITDQSSRVYQYEDKYSIFYNKKIESNLKADYQKENIILVLKSLEILYKSIYSSGKKTINSKTLKLDFSKEEFIDKCLSGLKKANWPGRFEFLKANNLNILLDGAHNDSGMKAFRNSIHQILDNSNRPIKVITIFACNKDKEYEKMLSYLNDITDSFIITKSHVEIKAKDPENISEYLNILNKDHKIVKDYRQTLEFACKIISERNYDIENVLICVCGSLYLVGAMRELINNLKD